MTQDTGGGIHNYFSRTVQETEETPSGRYVQTVYNSEEDTYELQLREQRYGQPVLLSEDLGQEEDAEQLLLEARERGINQLLEPSTGREVSGQ